MATAGPRTPPVGGTLRMHFGDHCLLPDGMWLEGAPAYQTGITSCGLFNTAEILWHHGIDMYRFRNGALKRLLDSALVLAYPDSKLNVAALHDSAPFALLDSAPWLNNEIGVAYECGYRRYQDPAYVPIIRNATKGFSMTSMAAGPRTSSICRRPIPFRRRRWCRPISIRSATACCGCRGRTGPNQLLMEYGPVAGHAHPSKLGIDVYALGDVSMPFPGVIFPYNDPMDPKWYWTTLGNCALTVDEKVQRCADYWYKFPGSAAPQAYQLVFGTASTMGIQRAWANTLYPGTTQDRALFLTPQYMADLFGGFGTEPHKYDLAWHMLGTATTSLKADPYQFPEPVAAGYNGLDNVTRASTDQSYTATVATLTQPDHPPDRGGRRTDRRFPGQRPLPSRPQGHHAALPHSAPRRAEQHDLRQRRRSLGRQGRLPSRSRRRAASRTVTGCSRSPPRRESTSALRRTAPAATARRASRPDALQAFARSEGNAVTALYLGGGTRAKVGEAFLARSEPGLAFVEKTPGGTYVVGNPSPSDGTVTVDVPGLAGLKSYQLDAQGKRGDPGRRHARLRAGLTGPLAQGRPEGGVRGRAEHPAIGARGLALTTSRLARGLGLPTGYARRGRGRDGAVVPRVAALGPQAPEERADVQDAADGEPDRGQEREDKGQQDAGDQPVISPPREREGLERIPRADDEEDDEPEGRPPQHAQRDHAVPEGELRVDADEPQGMKALPERLRRREVLADDGIFPAMEQAVHLERLPAGEERDDDVDRDGHEHHDQAEPLAMDRELRIELLHGDAEQERPEPASIALQAAAVVPRFQ